MSEGPDKESKTELPTEKRISDAVEKGNTPFSRELVTLGSMLALLAVASLMAAYSMKRMTILLAGMLQNPGDMLMENRADFGIYLRDIFSETAFIVLPPMLVMAIGGIVASIGQNMPSATLERLAPKMERLSPGKNFSRIFGTQGLLEFLKVSFKTVVVLIVAGKALYDNVDRILAASARDVGDVPTLMLELTIDILGPLVFLALMIGIADAVYTRIKWRNDLMMTRQENKDEHKSSEGDPHVKQRIKMLGRQRIQKNMMANLPKATVVVVNPTHYAVAMRYLPEEGGAPLVIAKGLDHLALRIRGKCEELGIPVVEDKPLARSLYAGVNVGDMIPPEFYKAVAEIIHFVNLRKRLGSKRT